jgi:hypothetical protein
MDTLTSYQIEAEERAEARRLVAEREIGAIRAELRRAVQLSVGEARRERERRKEMRADLQRRIEEIAAAQKRTDEALESLSAAQKRTEEKLERLLDRWDRDR